MFMSARFVRKIYFGTSQTPCPFFFKRRSDSLDFSSRVFVTRFAVHVFSFQLFALSARSTFIAHSCTHFVVCGLRRGFTVMRCCSEFFICDGSDLPMYTFSGHCDKRNFRQRREPGSGFSIKRVFGRSLFGPGNPGLFGVPFKRVRAKRRQIFAAEKNLFSLVCFVS